MFDEDDFNLGYDWNENGDVLYVNHLYLDEANRGNGWGSIILEMLVRFAYYEGATCVEVSIGGGDETKRALERNGFIVFREREYETMEGYGIDAVRKV